MKHATIREMISLLSGHGCVVNMSHCFSARPAPGHSPYRHVVDTWSQPYHLPAPGRSPYHLPAPGRCPYHLSAPGRNPIIYQHMVAAPTTYQHLIAAPTTYQHLVASLPPISTWSQPLPPTSTWSQPLPPTSTWSHPYHLSAPGRSPYHLPAPCLHLQYFYCFGHDTSFVTSLTCRPAKCFHRLKAFLYFYAHFQRITTPCVSPFLVIHHLLSLQCTISHNLLFPHSTILHHSHCSMIHHFP